MSRYEQVCDIIRQRREAAKKEREAIGFFHGGELDYLWVLQDAVAEMSGVDPAESTEEAIERRRLAGRRPFEGDVEEIGRLLSGITGEMYQRRRCILIHQRYTSWPLQSEMDA